MDIPLVDLKAQYLTIKEEIDKKIQFILDNSLFLEGEPLGKFERNLAQFCNCKYAVGTSSGTSALFLALKAHGIKSGDEVITAPNSFIATAGAIIDCGAKPVFIDVNEKTALMDLKKIKEKITNKTKAILPVHLYGQICDMGQLNEIAIDNNLLVIEDAAQSINATYKKKKNPLAETAIFSFFPAKNLGAYGDAGAVVTNNNKIAEKITMLRDHGRKSKYEYLIHGYNTRMDTLQAAILDVKLDHINNWTEKRRKNAKLYNELLNGIVTIPFEKEDCKHAYHLYVIKTEKRDKLQEFLKQNGIKTGIHYPIPLHLQPALSHLNYNEGDFPITERLSKQILSLPMYPELTEEQMQYITLKIKEFNVKNN